jgi:hypothetical protein
MTNKDNGEVVRCNNCKTVLDENPSIHPSERTPCPNCGSLSRYYEKVAHIKIGTSIPKTEVKVKHLGKGKPFIEQRTKHDLYRKTGQGTDEVRIIDRENNLYKKIIKDSKTGEIIYECCEPLDKHIGHDSAKLRIRHVSYED